jgi:hypothetical protein
MAETTYTYSIAQDFPDGKANPSKLDEAIRQSSIVTALEGVNTFGDVLNVVFKDSLSAGDKLTLDGDTTHPAGGLIASTDNTPDAPTVQPVEFQTPQLTYPKPVNIGKRITMFSHNFCDRTTWYTMSVPVSNEAVGTGTGSQTEFNLAHTYVIDVNHGKITDEDWLKEPTVGNGVNYVPVVKVDGVTQTEREFGELTGGDYEIDYKTGKLTFYVAPATGTAVTVSYYYSPDTDNSYNIFGPKTGKKWSVTDIELQFSADVVLSDEMTNAVWVYNPYDLPNKVIYPPSVARLKRSFDLVNWSILSFPLIPAFGGPVRGNASNIILLRFQYVSPIIITASTGAEIRFWLKHHREFAGDFASATLYGLEDDE